MILIGSQRNNHPDFRLAQTYCASGKFFGSIHLKCHSLLFSPKYCHATNQYLILVLCFIQFFRKIL